MRNEYDDDYDDDMEWAVRLLEKVVRFLAAFVLVGLGTLVLVHGGDFAREFF